MHLSGGSLDLAECVLFTCLDSSMSNDVQTKPLNHSLQLRKLDGITSLFNHPVMTALICLFLIGLLLNLMICNIVQHFVKWQAETTVNDDVCTRA